MSGSVTAQKAFLLAAQNGTDPQEAFIELVKEKTEGTDLKVELLESGTGYKLEDGKGGYIVLAEKSGYEPLRPLDAAKASRLCANHEKYASQLAMNARAKGGR